MRLVLIISSVLLITGCELFNPDEPIPSFIEIDAMTVSTTSSQGSGSQNISDAWVYLNDDLVGAFELPARVPVISDAPGEITVLGGIKENGIANTRIAYPFYTGYSENLALDPGTTYDINPDLNYSSSASFDFVEGFEMGNSFSKTSISDTILNRTTNGADVFEGSFSGEIILEGDINFIEVASTLAYELPLDGSDIFIELDYRSEIEFQIGFQSNGDLISKNYVLTVTPKGSWNKIYINIGKAVSVFQGDDHNILIKATLPDGVSDASIQLDNIKLIH